MNQKKYYNKIRKLRNKKFEQNLDFGCVVDVKNKIGYIINAKIVDNFILGYILFHKNSTISQVLTDNFKIIGKPVTLTDILRMLEKHLDIMEVHHQVLYNEDKEWYIDLTKEIKDQPEEILKKLYNLLK